MKKIIKWPRYEDDSNNPKWNDELVIVAKTKKGVIIRIPGKENIGFFYPAKYIEEKSEGFVYRKKEAVGAFGFFPYDFNKRSIYEIRIWYGELSKVSLFELRSKDEIKGKKESKSKGRKRLVDIIG